MDTLHPPHISELKQSIARYLDFESLCTCATVCRAWYDDIQPLVWRTYRINRKKLSTYGLETWIVIMSKNAHFIWRLHHYGFYDDTPISAVAYDTLLKYCRELVQIKWYARNIDEWIGLKELVQVNTALHSLTLEIAERGNYDYSLYAMFTRPFGIDGERHAQMKSLQLHCQISTETLKHILLACPALEEATIAVIRNKTIKIVSSDNANNNSNKQGREWDEYETPTTSIPSLSSKLYSVYIAQYCDDPALINLLEHLPSLTCLKMPFISASVFQQLRQTIQKGLPSQIKTISLRELSTTLTSQFVLPVLHAIPRHQLQNVTLEDVGLVETRCLIDRQHRSLESVVLHSAHPETLVALLTECPYLKKVSAVSEDPVDVRQLLNQPWTCASSLEELSAMPCLPPATEGVDTAMIENEFMMNLGQCTQLGELMISQHDGEETVQLSWSLAHGLNHLASLSRLEKVGFGGWMYFEVPELQFMREH